MPPPADTLLPEAVVDAAILWSVRLGSRESPRTQAAFAQWLAADPLHAQAWQQVGQLRESLAELPPQLAQRTLAQAQAQRTHTQRAARRRTLSALSLGGLAVAAGWGLRDATPWQRLVADASTPVGERRTWVLEDGSQILLNTDTAVRARFTPALRDVQLLRGEILVTTGTDAIVGRPFIVSTPFGRVQALGTRFVVRLAATGVQVSVLEHAVRLQPAHGGTPLRLEAGQSAWLQADSTTNAVPMDTQAFWADGLIAARHQRLADLLDELARYRHGVILCDAAVAELRVSGLFQVDDVAHALNTLALTHPVRIVHYTRWVTRVVPA